MARIYAERACRPVARWDKQGGKIFVTKLPLVLFPNHGAFPEAYAEVLSVAARISHVQGNIFEALAEITEAVALDPGNEDYIPQLEEYDQQKWKITAKKERRKEAQMFHKQKIFQEGKQHVNIAEYRERRADDAFRAGNIADARRIYEFALSKLEKTEEMKTNFLHNLKNHWLLGWTKIGAI